MGLLGSNDPGRGRKSVKHKADRGKRKTPAAAWQALVEAELKTGSKLGKILEKSGFGGYDYDKGTLTLYFPDDALGKAARGQKGKLQKKLPPELLPCDQLECVTGSVPTTRRSPTTFRDRPHKPPGKLGNPLQALNIAEFGYDKRGEELTQPVLAAAATADQTCQTIYTKLKHRTELLAGNSGITFPVSFSWRLRVGGTRGFRELLLPAFHPVFGIPYIPASTLKGATLAWARSHHEAETEVLNELFGMLEGRQAKAARVEFLDAFPTQPCLSVDVATPQWHWKNNQVEYKPEPHPLLSLAQPQILIGLRPTAIGTADDVQMVKAWLAAALKAGIGSRVSSGYGRALDQQPQFPHSQSYNFELWTQGIYGSDTQQSEFRATAVRGLLRYWFRAFALGIYTPTVCQTLEDTIFGKLSQWGQLSLSTLCNPPTRSNPDLYTGKIVLEARDQKILHLVERLLKLTAHLGGVGRGSRRPLHVVNGRMRGCHWSVDDTDMPLAYDTQAWQDFFKQLRQAFKAVEAPLGNYTCDPGKPKHRKQDTLDRQAQVWLVQSDEQISPDQVTDWTLEGDNLEVRGTALNLLYGDDQFKGKSQENPGNANVGGALGTPSFVWIKSIFPDDALPYQVVTLFGVKQNDRLRLAKALNQLKRQGRAKLVFGAMPKSS